MTWSTTDVPGSSTCRIAEWAPADGLARTLMVAGVFRARSTESGALKVPSSPTQRSVCRTLAGRTRRAGDRHCVGGRRAGRLAALSHSTPVVDAGSLVRGGKGVRDLGADRRGHGVAPDVRPPPEQVPGSVDIELAVALSRRRQPGDEVGAGVDRRAHLRRRDRRAGLAAGGQEQRGGAGGLRRGHRGPVEHRVARRQRVAGLCDIGLLEPAGNRRDGGAGRHHVGLEPAVLARTAGGEVVQVQPGGHDRAVVGPPGVLGDGRGDADDVRGHRGVADGVEARPAVAGRDEQLDPELVDEPVVELGAGVGAVVEDRQATDRHVDDVDAAA